MMCIFVQLKCKFTHLSVEITTLFCCEARARGSIIAPVSCPLGVYYCRGDRAREVALNANELAMSREKTTPTISGTRMFPAAGKLRLVKEALARKMSVCTYMHISPHGLLCICKSSFLVGLCAPTWPAKSAMLMRLFGTTCRLGVI